MKETKVLMVSLKREAELLGANRETFEHPMTEWAEANEARYREFEELLVELYYDGKIASEQAYQLAGEALYDFDFPFEEGEEID